VAEWKRNSKFQAPPLTPALSPSDGKREEGAGEGARVRGPKANFVEETGKADHKRAVVVEGLAADADVVFRGLAIAPGSEGQRFSGFGRVNGLAKLLEVVAGCWLSSRMRAPSARPARAAGVLVFRAVIRRADFWVCLRSGGKAETDLYSPPIQPRTCVAGSLGLEEQQPVRRRERAARESRGISAVRRRRFVVFIQSSL
jgi:hypothetical protein